MVEDYDRNDIDERDEVRETPFSDIMEYSENVKDNSLSDDPPSLSSHYLNTSFVDETSL